MLQSVEKRTFDRTRDVPKLIGANTRNVEYRWSIFERYLDRIPRGSHVLDFGAGSLRETWDLAQRGYRVTSIDLDRDVLDAYAASYDWSKVEYRPEILVAPNLLSIRQRFALITTFDVFEHLAHPVPVMERVRNLLADDGFLFCTVPNGRTLFEVSFRLDLRIAHLTGRRLTPGEPHLQRNSPRRWRAIFDSAGFDVLEHDMAVGFLANTWNAMVQVPSLLVGRIGRGVGLKFPAMVVVDTLCHPRVMSGLDRVDRATKRAMKGLFGWNLIVARKKHT